MHVLEAEKNTQAQGKECVGEKSTPSSSSMAQKKSKQIHSTKPTLLDRIKQINSHYHIIQEQKKTSSFFLRLSRMRFCAYRYFCSGRRRRRSLLKIAQTKIGWNQKIIRLINNPLRLLRKNFSRFILN